MAANQFFSMRCAEDNFLFDRHHIFQLPGLILLLALPAQQLNIDNLQPIFPTQFAHPILRYLEILLGLYFLAHFAAQLLWSFLPFLLASLAQVPG